MQDASILVGWCLLVFSGFAVLLIWRHCDEHSSLFNESHSWFWSKKIGCVLLLFRINKCAVYNPLCGRVYFQERIYTIYANCLCAWKPLKSLPFLWFLDKIFHLHVGNKCLLVWHTSSLHSNSLLLLCMSKRSKSPWLVSAASLMMILVID